MFYSSNNFDVVIFILGKVSNSCSASSLIALVASVQIYINPVKKNVTNYGNKLNWWNMHENSIRYTPFK